MQLHQAHAVVTGGGSGIGAAIAGALLDKGALVTVMGRRLEVLQTAIESFPNSGNASAVICDVSDEQSTATAFAQATQTTGPIQVLINCAGMAPTQAFHKLTSAQWNEVMGVNLNGVFHCTAQVIGPMRDSGFGRIVNIASTAALKGYAYVSAYSAAKHGVLGLTRALALETASKGITVNAICPGYTDTDIIRQGIANIVEKTGRSEAQALASFTDSNPQGRLIEPAEIAATVLWLCADGSESITGQAISLSGGEVM